MALGLAGETGEAIDVIKKIDRGSLNLDDAGTRTKLGLEIADVFIYLLNICALIGFDPQSLIEQKQVYNEKRFTAERARREQLERM